jgi:hypothetical protein
MRAFETFTTDLESCLSAVRLLRTVLEKELAMDAERSADRQEALERMPKIADSNLPSNYLIHRASQMAGRTIEKVEYGQREDYPNVHRSELIHIHFTDGAIVSLSTGSNARNLSMQSNDTIRPEDLHVDFVVEWVPPR